MSRYDVTSILESITLPIGNAAKRFKEVGQQQQQHHIDSSSNMNWPSIATYHHQHPNWFKQEHDLNPNLQLGTAAAPHNFFLHNMMNMNQTTQGPNRSVIYPAADASGAGAGAGYFIPNHHHGFGDQHNIFSSANVNVVGTYEDQWVPTGVPTAASRSNNSNFHGGGSNTFSFWNDT